MAMLILIIISFLDSHGNNLGNKIFKMCTIIVQFLKSVECDAQTRNSSKLQYSKKEETRD